MYRKWVEFLKQNFMQISINMSEYYMGTTWICGKVFPAADLKNKHMSKDVIAFLCSLCVWSKNKLY